MYTEELGCPVAMRLLLLAFYLVFWVGLLTEFGDFMEAW
jgi:hypothetical protein